MTVTRPVAYLARLCFALAVALVLATTCSRRADAQNVRTMRLELVALDDSIRKTEAKIDSIQQELACLNALDPYSYALIRRCFQNLAPTPIVYRPALSREAKIVYVAGLVTIPAVNAVFRLDVDHGGYRDSFRTRDKREHAAYAAALTFAAAAYGVQPGWAAAGTCAGGGLYELSQRHASWRDATINCATSAGVAVFLRWVDGR